MYHFWKIGSLLGLRPLIPASEGHDSGEEFAEQVFDHRGQAGKSDLRSAQTEGVRPLPNGRRREVVQRW